jgi:hypothetical protein
MTGFPKSLTDVFELDPKALNTTAPPNPVLPMILGTKDYLVHEHISKHMDSMTMSPKRIANDISPRKNMVTGKFKKLELAKLLKMTQNPQYAVNLTFDDKSLIAKYFIEPNNQSDVRSPDIFKAQPIPPNSNNGLLDRLEPPHPTQETHYYPHLLENTK